MDRAGTASDPQKPGPSLKSRAPPLGSRVTFAPSPAALAALGLRPPQQPQPEPEPEPEQAVPEATPPRGKRSSNSKSPKKGADQRRITAMAAELDLMTTLLDRVEHESTGLRQETASLREELENTRAELARERARADAADARARDAEAASPHLGHAASRLEKAQARREHTAAVLLQANWRGRKDRASAQQLKQAVEQKKLQASPRVRAAQARREHTAATLVQAHWRGCRAREPPPAVSPPRPEQAKAAASEAAELKHTHAAEAAETLVAGLIERAEAAEARAAAAEAALAKRDSEGETETRRGGAMVSSTAEADDPLSQEQVSRWALELDTIVRLEELLRASEGTVKLLQHGVSETVESLKQQSPVKKKA